MNKNKDSWDSSEFNPFFTAEDVHIISEKFGNLIEKILYKIANKWTRSSKNVTGFVEIVGETVAIILNPERAKMLREKEFWSAKYEELKGKYFPNLKQNQN
jgi:hypothetical protein